MERLPMSNLLVDGPPLTLLSPTARSPIIYTRADTQLAMPVWATTSTTPAFRKIALNKKCKKTT
jgi:hypothetical protein